MAEQKQQRLRHPDRVFLLVGVILAMVLTVYLALQTRFGWHAIWCLSLSVATFLIYGFDKWASKRSWQRAPESALHTLNLAGGFLGGLLGRSLFRHKTNKTAFLVVPIVALLAHAALWWWL